MGNLLPIAQHYLSLGWPVLPARPDEKFPLIEWTAYQRRLPTDDELQVWFDAEGFPSRLRFLDARLGMATGQLSRVVVIELDPRPNNAIDLDAFCQQFPTGRIALSGLYDTPRGPQRGRHLYFTHPGFPQKTAANCFLGFPGVDCRADGGFVVLPPSPHPSGVVYEWLTEGELAPLPPAFYLPRDPKAASDSEGPLYPTSGSRCLTPAELQEVTDLMKGEWVDGQKHDQARCFVGALLKAGVSEQQTCDALTRACGNMSRKVLRDHRAQIASTRRRLHARQPVEGIAGLRRTLPDATCDALWAILARQASTPTSTPRASSSLNCVPAECVAGHSQWRYMKVRCAVHLTPLPKTAAKSSGNFGTQIPGRAFRQRH